MAFSKDGKLLTSGRTPSLSGGTIQTGVAASITDLSCSAPGDTGFRYSFTAGGTAQIDVSWGTPDDVSYVVFVNKAAYVGTWAATSIISHAAGATLDLLDAAGAPTWTSSIGATTDTAFLKVFQPPGNPGITLPAAPNQTATLLNDGIRYLFFSPASNFVYIREVIVLVSD